MNMNKKEENQKFDIDTNCNSKFNISKNKKIRVISENKDHKTPLTQVHTHKLNGIVYLVDNENIVYSHEDVMRRCPAHRIGYIANNCYYND